MKYKKNILCENSNPGHEKRNKPGIPAMIPNEKQEEIKNSSLIVFLRPPRLGKVKTRLGNQITRGFALFFYKECINILMSEIRNSVEFEKYLFWSDEVMNEEENSYPEFNCYYQTGHGLGLRMKNAFEQVFKLGETKVILIGTDIPDLNNELIHTALSNLEKNDIVLGPAKDGGYYLIGMKKMHGFLFEEVEYSVPSVLEATISKIEESGLSYSLLEELTDIDTEDDLVNWLRSGACSRNKENISINYFLAKKK